MQFKDRHRVIPAAYVVFRDGNQILLLKRANTGYFDGSYSLPAGHIAGGESAIAAAAREAKEEVGVTISLKNLQLVHVMHRSSDIPVDHERVDFYFEAYRWKGKVKNCEPYKCDELRWCGLKSLPQNMVPEVRFALKKLSEGKIYSDFNFSGG